MMETESTSTAVIFQPEALVWAKMKGFPPWPAKVLEPAANTPVGRIPVMFFGTRENAFMKPSDVSDYLTNKEVHEIPRKHKGFNEGVHEIRVAAGVEEASFRDPLFFGTSESRQSPSPMLGSSHPRHRLDALISGFDRKRTNSASTVSRSRASSSASALKLLRNEMRKRQRMDSESSGGSRRNKMISGLGDKITGDLMDHLMPMDPDFNLLDEALNMRPEDGGSIRSKRSRGSSKVFDDYFMSLGQSRNRLKSGGASENGRRSRLISGVSDVFDDLFHNNDLQFAAEQLMNVLDEMPSESSEGRARTPETPAPLPEPSQFCTSCGCECQIFGNKWRCMGKKCLKWNGIVQPFNQQPSTSKACGYEDSTLREIKTEPLANIPSSQAEEKSSLNTVPEKKKEKEEKKPRIRIKRETDSPKKTRDRIKQEYDEDLALASSVKDKKRVQLISPQRSPTVEKRANGRPKQYKVEKTPPIGKDGRRNCSFCNGQVRPQMCGGNKHRWRCVDKKCRKWYGWVRSSDEIPSDLGRGRHNGALGKKPKRKEVREKPRVDIRNIHAEPASISSAGEAAAAAAGLDNISLFSDDRTTVSGRNDDPMRRALKAAAQMVVAQEMPRKKGRPPKQSGLKIKLNTKSGSNGLQMEEEKRTKRKYTRRKDREALLKEIEQPKREVSPLTELEAEYKPSAMEKRARWWLSEKRRMETSPEREFQTTPADAAAAFRILSHAFRAAAVTRADEIGTVNGSLDLLMDSLMASMAPLLSLLGKLPNTRPDPEVLQQLWNASAVHTPMFQ